MTEAVATAEVIRQFLLGDLDEGARQRLEEAFICDPQTRDLVLMNEDELIDDYLEGSLSAAEQDKFLRHYLSGPQQRRKLRIAESLRAYIAAEVGPRTSPASRSSVWTTRLRGVYSELKGRPLLILGPVILVLLPAIVSVAIMQVQLQRTRSAFAEKSARWSAIEQELVQLNQNSRPGPEQPDQIMSLELAPTAPRSLGGGAQLTPTTKTSIVELRLIWTEKEEYQIYLAELKKVDTNEAFVIPLWQFENGPRGKAVRLKIPAKILTRGTYQVELSGLGVDGKTTMPAQYTFMVSR